MASPAVTSLQFASSYLESLLSGDSEGAGEALREAVGTLGVRRTHLELLAPAQRIFGEKWLRGEVNVVRHHLANQIMEGHLERLARAAPFTKPLGATVVMVAPAEERHTFGARMVADFLRFDGFAVDFLGGDTPQADLLEFVRRSRPDLVGVSVTMTENLPAARKAATRLKSLACPPTVLCGGVAVNRSFGGEGLPEADGWAPHAAETVRQARRLLGLGESVPSLEGYLKSFGRRVRRLRKSRGWTQSRLARAAGLDRGYVSSVENGKHNLTVSVALKLAEALEVPLGWLISARAEAGPAASGDVVGRVGR